jgi:hypothetical protein
MSLSSRMQFRLIVALAVIAWLPLMPRTSEAQRRGGGGARGGGGRSGGGGGEVARGNGARTSSGGGNRLSGGYGGAARTSVNRDFGNTSADRANVNRNVNNVNVNRNWNTDIDVDNGWGWGGGHPVAAGAAFAAGAAVTSAAIGSVAYSLPAACSVVVVNGISYQHCGSTWYEPQFAGTSVSYVVVGSPQ